MLESMKMIDIIVLEVLKARKIPYLLFTTDPYAHTYTERV